MQFATDRYQALKMPCPNVETMCKGQCDGVGFYLCKNDEQISEVEFVYWQAAHNAHDAHTDEPCDGWHFIKCADCGGTGNTPE